MGIIAKSSVLDTSEYVQNIHTHTHTRSHTTLQTMEKSQ